MSESSLDTVLDGVDSRALSCVAALRIGGGLYILADAAGSGDLYYQVDAGVRAGLRSCEGRRLNTDAVRIATKACQRLTSTFSSEGRTRQFALSGFALLANVIASLNSQADERPEAYVAIFQEALELASNWPGEVLIDGHVGLREFEFSCQRESVERLRSEGIPGLRNVLRVRELGYRGLAKGAI